MRTFRTLFVLLILSIPVLAAIPEDSLSTASSNESFSFRKDANLGVGLFGGAFGGIGASVRMGGTAVGTIGTQISAYFYAATGSQSNGSIGVEFLIPIKVYEHSRYSATAGMAYFSESSSKGRVGAGVMGEWLTWTRLGVSVGLDVITFFDDGTIIVPSVSGGLHIYF